MQPDRTTLTQFLIAERRRHPTASGDLNALILNVALACKAISKRVAYGALVDLVGADRPIVPREPKQKLKDEANQLFVRTTEWGGQLAGLVSDERELPYRIPTRYPRGKYLLTFAALDGVSSLDVNLPVSSIFSIRRARQPGEDAVVEDFLQPGSQQICAGYAIYGPSTVLVITVGTGVHGFTLDPQLGEFILTHPELRIAPAASEFAINAASSRFWEPAVKRYVDECVAGKSGPRGKDFSMRWGASLVVETHRILMRGGRIFIPARYPGSRSAGVPAAPLRSQPAQYAHRAGGRTCHQRSRVDTRRAADVPRRAQRLHLWRPRRSDPAHPVLSRPQ